MFQYNMIKDNKWFYVKRWTSGDRYELKQIVINDYETIFVGLVDISDEKESSWNRNIGGR